MNEKCLDSLKSFKSMNNFRDNVLILKKQKKLHSFAQAVIMTIIRRRFQKSLLIPETAKLSVGHRADLLLRLPSNELVHFEIFADQRTVSRDINCFENSPARHKISIILDDEIDKKVADQYFHELDSRRLPHDIYHKFFLSDVLVRSKQRFFLDKVEEIISGSKEGFYIELRELKKPAKEWNIIREETETVAIDFIQRLKYKHPTNLFVTGPRGIGKSSFLNRLVELILQYRIHCIKREVVSEDWNEFLSELIDRCEKLLIQNGLSIPSSKTSKQDTIVQLVTKIGERIGPIAIVIDRFERLFEEGEIRATSAKLERIWDGISEIINSSQSHGRIAWVIAARQQYFFMIFPSLRLLKESNFSYLSIGLLKPSESLGLVNRICEVSGYRLAEKAKLILARNTSNHPQNVVLSFINLCYGKTNTRKISARETLAKKPWKDLLEEDLNRLDSEAEKLVLYAIADTMKETSTFQEIRGKVCSELNMTENELKDVIRNIQNKTNLIEEPRKGILQFFHPRVGDLIREKYRDTFPVKWDTDRLSLTAIYLLQKGDYLKAADGYWYWYPIPELLAKAIMVSSDYEPVLDKALEIIRNDALKDEKKLNRLGLDAEQEALWNQWLFLVATVEACISQEEEESPLVCDLKDKLQDIAMKYSAMYSSVADRISSICIFARVFKERLEDKNRALVLASTASRMMEETNISPDDDIVRNIIKFYKKELLANA